MAKIKVIEPYFEILDEINCNTILKRIEQIGRTCYKSEDKITSKSASSFVKNLILNKHESVLEHVSISVRIVCDRGVSHELVRHRIASYSQESTRYCNYSNDKFGNELTFIKPWFFNNNDVAMAIWEDAMNDAEKSYMKLLSIGVKPEEARSVLPTSLKTEVVATMNLREWRHFFKLRTVSSAHPQMREIAVPIALKFKALLPQIFGDLI